MFKINLQRFDNNFADCYDMENDTFVIYAGMKGKQFEIATTAEITDYQGNKYICWLWAVSYLPELGCYKLEYKQKQGGEKMTLAKRNKEYTKGDCYTICELLESLLQDNKQAIYDFAKNYNYEPDYILDLLRDLHNDTDSIIAEEQSEREDTDQMAIIMNLKHVAGHND